MVGRVGPFGQVRQVGLTINERSYYITKQVIWIVIILLLGLGLRVLYLSEAVQNPDFSAPLHDAEFKDYWARAILSGDYTPPRNEGNPFMEGHPLPNPPGYSLFLALIYWFTGGSYLAVRWVQIFIGLLNVLLVYLLGKKLFDYKAGLFSALGIATYWAFVHYDLELNQVTIYIAINLLFFYLLLYAYEKNKLLLLSFASFIFGVGAWFRGEVFVLTFPLTLFVVFLFYKSEQLRFAFKAGLSFFLFALLPVLPLASYNYYLCGSFTSGSHNSEFNISVAFHPETPEYATYTPEFLKWLNKTPEDTVETFDLDGMTLGLGKELGLGRRATYKEWRDYLIAGAINNIKTYPWLNFKKCLKRFLWTFSPQELDENKVIYYEREVSRILKYLPRFPLPMSLFVFSTFLFILSYIWKGKQEIDISMVSWRYLVVLFLYVGINISVFSLLIAGSRYRVSLIPYFFIFGGVVFSTFWKTIQEKKWRVVVPGIILFILLFSLAHIPFFNYQPNRSRWLDERRKCYQRIGQIEKGIEFFEKWLAKYPDADAHYHAGVLCYDSGQLTKAQEHFLTCLKLKPDHPSAPYNLGLVFAKNKNWKEALNYFEEAVKRNPNKADMWFALGWAKENLGDTITALEKYNRALNINPQHVQALNHSAGIMLRNGEQDIAKDYLEKAVAIAPDYADARFNLGQVLLGQRKPVEALKHFEVISGKYYPEYELLKSIGLCYVQMTDYKKALQYLAKAKQMGPEQWEEDSILAVCYAGSGKKEECIQLIEGIEEKELDIIQLFNIGHAWELLGDVDKAEMYYKSVLEKESNYADAWAGLGNICFSRGDKELAYVYYKGALKINPYQIGAWFNIILFAIRNKEWEKAKEQLTEFLNYYPEHEEGYYNLGLVYEALGNKDGAKQSYEKVLEKNPNHTGALFSRATIALSEMDLEKSQSLFERLIPMEPFKSLYHLGIIYSLKEKWYEAHEYFLKSYFINPEPFFNDYMYAFNLGRCYDRLGCLDEAELFYRVSFRLNPDFVDLKDAFSFLLLRQEKIEEAYFLLNSIFLYQVPTGWSYYHYSLVWEKMNEPAVALGYAEQAHKIMPNQSAVLHQLGGLYRKLGDYTSAEQYLEQARNINPNDATIFKTLAFLRADQERYKEAKELFGKCTKLLPQDAEVFEGLADVHVKTYELKQAEECYQKSLTIKESPTVINKLGLLLADLNKVDESIGLLEIAIKYFPNNAVTLTRLADLKVTLHSDTEAKSLYEKALLLDMKNYLTHRNYADLLVRSGEYEQAEKHYKLALELQPKDSIALAGLGLLYARMNKYEEAKQYLVPLAQVKTDLLTVNQQLAQIFLAENQPEKAMKYIKRCILAQPDRKEFRELLQQANQMKQ